MNIIESAAEFLRQTGLLAEINRVVLHPRGLALSVVQEDDGTISGFGPLQDVRDDPEGMVFGEADLAEAYEKLMAAEAAGICPILPLREFRLGFIRQIANLRSAPKK